MSDTLTHHREKSSESESPERNFRKLPDAGKAIALFEELNERRPPPKPPVQRTPLVLYGAGEAGVFARRHLSLVGMPIALVIDHEADRLSDDFDWRGVATAEPAGAEETIKAEALVAVAATDRPFRPLAKRLSGEGWRAVVPFLDLAEGCRERQPISGGWTARWLNKKDFASASAVLEKWADDRSRAHHLAFAAWRMRRSEWNFAGAPVTGEDHFLPVEVIRALRPDERLLEVGAFHGGGLLRFVTRPGQFSHAWAIEPDATNRAILEARLASHGRSAVSKVTVLPHLVGATAGPAPFRDGLGPWSQVAETGGQERAVVTIDELGLAPTFIMIDIPGGHAALEGARETLQRERPIVAVDVGHDPDGLWKIAQRLMTTLEGYAFLMRGHGWLGVRSVVYAIPEERASA